MDVVFLVWRLPDAIGKVSWRHPRPLTFGISLGSYLISE
jgi:hypothetical protein